MPLDHGSRTHNVGEQDSDHPALAFQGSPGLFCKDEGGRCGQAGVAGIIVRGTLAHWDSAVHAETRVNRDFRPAVGAMLGQRLSTREACLAGRWILGLTVETLHGSALQFVAGGEQVGEVKGILPEKSSMSNHWFIVSSERFSSPVMSPCLESLLTGELRRNPLETGYRRRSGGSSTLVGKRGAARQKVTA
jgi:hypothetical protein